jgi:hypothetical protein
VEAMNGCFGKFESSGPPPMPKKKPEVVRRRGKVKDSVEVEESTLVRTTTHLEFDTVVNHPAHYNAHPSGVECIEIVEHLSYNLGNAVKYVWRAGLKSETPIDDLKKAAWHVQREIERLEKGKAT